MEKVVNIVWRNGFGNQLFQYSYGKLFSEKNNIKLTHSGKGRACSADLFDYNFIENNIIRFDAAIHQPELNIDYNKIQALSLENPHNYKNHIIKIKQFYPVVEKTNTKDLVIHLRLGDNGPNIYTPFEWYKKAIKDNNIQFDKVYLVTDEPKSMDSQKFKNYYNANIFSTSTTKTIDDRANNITETLNDFNFIRSFNKILFSNSTFAWWASVLSNADEVYFNNEWQPNHYGGKIRLGETDYKNFKGICPFSLKQ